MHFMALDVTGKYQYPSPNLTWLELHREDIIEPALPIVDAHHHLWLEPGKEYLADDLLADLSTGHNIIATVFLEARCGYRDRAPAHLAPIGETQKVEAMRRELADRHPQYGACSGIVGFADLLAPHLLAEVLEAHRRASPRHFCGIRQSVARDSHFPEGIVLRPAAAGMLADPRFRVSLQTLARHGLSFDAMLYHEQIDELTSLARAAGDTQIIVDHIGCPIGVGPYRGKERETFQTWRRSMASLATCPNVAVKFGGLGMIILGAEHHLNDRPPTSKQLSDAWRPYFDACVASFGTSRCLFESNFPVDKAMFSYPILWNAYKRLASGASADDKDNLFSRTASRLYRLHAGHPTSDSFNVSSSTR